MALYACLVEEEKTFSKREAHEVGTVPKLLSYETLTGVKESDILTNGALEEGDKQRG